MAEEKILTEIKRILVEGYAIVKCQKCGQENTHEVRIPNLLGKSEELTVIYCHKCKEIATLSSTLVKGILTVRRFQW